jgi:hypothetical protein
MSAMEIRKGLVFVSSRSMSAVCLALLVAACSNPKNATIPTTIESLDSLSASVKKLTPEEQELFGGYFMRHVIGAKMGGMFGIKATPIPEGMTIGKAIDEQRAYLANEAAKDADEKALKEKVLKEREQAMIAMRSAVTVTLVSKKIATESMSGIETDRKIEIVIAYRNNTDKIVAGVKGTLDVNDLFGDELSGFAVSNETTIAPGATITWTGGRSIKFSMNSNKDEKLAGLADDKYKVVWNPKMIIFADGTKLTAPDG